jgi:glyoxylase-like metal-dependent hydrolase (beta-lactamase superfamily II)
VVAVTGASVVVGTPDADAVTEQTGVPVDRRVGEGDTVTVGACDLAVVPLAGHTPGSIALLYDDPAGHPHLFTGDSLFPGGVGATFGDTVAFAQLLDEVATKVFERLPDDTWFYPGHGADGRLGDERPHLAEWRERGW